MMFGGMESLTGGGGLSASSSAASRTGDQGTGGFSVGPFSPNLGGISDKQLMIGGGIVLTAVAIYAFSKKKRK